MKIRSRHSRAGRHDACHPLLPCAADGRGQPIPAMQEQKPHAASGRFGTGASAGVHARTHDETLLDKLTRRRNVCALKRARKSPSGPKIQELRKKADDARDEFMAAVRQKMQQIDPGLDDIVKKKGLRSPRRPGPPRGPEGAGMEKLSPQERARLDTARDKAKDDPTVTAAKATMHPPRPRGPTCGGGSFPQSHARCHGEQDPPSRRS